MAPTEPPDPTAGRDPDESAGPGAAEAALRALEERLGRASEAAERLIAEAAGAAARSVGDPAAGREASGGGAEGRAADGAEGQAADGAHRAARDQPDDRPPPSGWASAEPESRGDLDALVRFAASLRDLIPPELQRRLAEAVRELLLAVRALIDWYLERMESRRREPAAVEDIPIL